MTERGKRWLIVCERIAQRRSVWLGRFLWSCYDTVRTVNARGWAGWWEDRSPREPPIWRPLPTQFPDYLQLDQMLQRAIRKTLFWPSFDTPKETK